MENKPDFKNEGEFFHFGILPQVCIHSVIEDEYSKSYVPREKCECGSTQWKENGCTMILGHYPDGRAAIIDVHRCAKCDDIRMADHLSVFEEKNEDNLTVPQNAKEKN